MSCVKVPLDVDHRCRVVGELYYSENFDELGQDMVEVHLPGGILVEAGWFPEGSRQGSYRVTTTSGFIEKLPEFATTDVFAARERIASIVRMFCDGVPLLQSVSGSDEWTVPTGSGATIVLESDTAVS